jgi:TPR repeat protein
VPQDPAQGEAWLRKAAAQGDEPSAELLRALPTLDAAAQSPEALAEFVRKLAESGYAVAQYQLSRFYAEGTGVPKDKQLEVEWERKAAEQDHVEALGSYANRLVLTHDGVKGDFWKGYSYLYRAGALGHVQSQRVLGLLYQKGTGVKKDVVTSLIWLDVAVMAGDAPAKRLRDAVLSEATPRQVEEANRRAIAWMKRPPKERATPEGAP